ncbi:hypothetical protein KIH87_00790 [Paraneptunicella aestuarii]|uniref:hypothetical protein n=1 Tax=Paraneptunicella aestuarii TaxID=2831148 RepID=UPI001E4B1B08|nr:hypothetical protein [Paraneptunicella aestuarii]UAA38944.1 hypothetical protein KIH87_00790 [Paraneptunicella aestuarii]
MKVANPQGKGLVAVFKDWHAPIVIEEQRDLSTLVKDYLLSLMVLSAKFKFRPVRDKEYYLYLKRGELIMTLIEPEKSGERFGKYVGSCYIKPELTWGLEFSELSKTDPDIQDYIQSFYRGFEDHHGQNVDLLSLLPFFEESLPFYARMYANGLAKSIEQGMVSLGMGKIKANLLLNNSESLQFILPHKG